MVSPAAAAEVPLRRLVTTTISRYYDKIYYFISTVSLINCCCFMKNIPNWHPTKVLWKTYQIAVFSESRKHVYYKIYTDIHNFYLHKKDILCYSIYMIVYTAQKNKSLKTKWKLDFLTWNLQVLHWALIFLSINTLITFRQKTTISTRWVSNIAITFFFLW